VLETQPGQCVAHGDRALRALGETAQFADRGIVERHRCPGRFGDGAVEGVGQRRKLEHHHFRLAAGCAPAVTAARAEEPQAAGAERVATTGAEGGCDAPAHHGLELPQATGVGAHRFVGVVAAAGPEVAQHAQTIMSDMVKSMADVVME